MNPTNALLLSALIAAALAALLWPEKGLLPRWRHLRHAGERTLLEDALKHLYDCEYLGRSTSVASLSGALQIPQGRATEIIILLESQSLSKSTENGPRLTSSGRDYALRVLRIHRLWEQHLAQRTGVSHSDWHRLAERREHDLSETEADHLAAEMGHPVFDPHGDPIPTAGGDIAPRQGYPLTALSQRELATIVHFEDEPEDVYEELSSLGLHLGMSVEVMETSDDSVHFMADGTIYNLAPAMAANVYVMRMPVEEEMGGPYTVLADLCVQERGTVVRISPACYGLERRRLMDLGIVTGTVIEMQMRSPSGDPTAYCIRGATIALRKEQAELIQITRELGGDA